MSEINKILIHLPNDQSEVLEAIPFLVTVRNYYPEAELNLICETDFSEAIEPAIEKFEYHTIGDENYKNFLSIHKYAFNLLPVFNIDLSVSLRPGWKSPFLAFCFRSRNRLGVYNLRSRPFLTHNKKFTDIPTAGQLGFELLSYFTKGTLKKTDLALPEFDIDDEDFHDFPIIDFVLTKQELESRENQRYFKELCEQIEGVKFRFFQFGETKETEKEGLQNLEEVEEKDWKIDLNKENKYFFSNTISTINELLQKSSYSIALVTTNPVLDFYADYLSTPSFQLFGAESGFVRSDGTWDVNRLADQLSAILKSQ